MAGSNPHTLWRDTQSVASQQAVSAVVSGVSTLVAQIEKLEAFKPENESAKEAGSVLRHLCKTLSNTRNPTLMGEEHKKLEPNATSLAR